MSTRYKQTIQIGRNVTDIMALPCVIGCRKESIEPTTVVYSLFGDTEARHIRWGQPVEARPTDWLCEDYDGRWHLLTAKDYQETIKNETNL